MEFKDFQKKIDFQKIKDRIYKRYGAGINRNLFESMQCDMGADPPTQTTTNDPWIAQQPHLKRIFGGAKDFYEGGGADLFPDALTAARDPNTPAGEQSIIDFINQGQFGDTGAAAAGATIDMFQNPYGQFEYGELGSDPSQYGLTSPEQDEALNQMMSGDPFRNPFTTQVADAFTQDMLETYNRDIAPAARSAQIAYQPGGSSRGELVNARNVDDLNENIGNMRSSFFNNAYNRALDNQGAGVGQYTQRAGLGEAARGARAGEGLNRYGGAAQGYGSVLDTITRGYGAQAGIGEDRRAFDQEQIDEQAFRFDYDQNRDYYNLQDYMKLIQGDFGGQQVTSYDAGVSDLQRGLGMGAGLMSMIPGFG